MPSHFSLIVKWSHRNYLSRKSGNSSIAVWRTDGMRIVFVPASNGNQAGWRRPLCQSISKCRSHIAGKGRFDCHRGLWFWRSTHTWHCSDDKTVISYQNADEKKVESMLSSVRKVIAGLQGEKVVQLGLIKGGGHLKYTLVCSDLHLRLHRIAMGLEFTGSGRNAFQMLSSACGWNWVLSWGYGELHWTK